MKFFRFFIKDVSLLSVLLWGFLRKRQRYQASPLYTVFNVSFMIQKQATLVHIFISFILCISCDLLERQHY
ncbi:hypothetical protein XENTR_v10020367 [Xenopus tropicalis]|nr:hypothetical protein XENTR_v10020367 [Xenopus tropicalis]KAE8582904.1 hypothetical protein XENTR_v10020367 [Xenopus tropicalis]